MRLPTVFSQTRLKSGLKGRSRARRPTCVVAKIPSTQVDGQRQRRSQGAISIASASNPASHRLKSDLKGRSRAGRPTCVVAKIPSTQVDGQRQRRSQGTISIASASNLTSHRLKSGLKGRSRAGRPTCVVAKSRPRRWTASANGAPKVRFQSLQPPTRPATD